MLWRRGNGLSAPTTPVFAGALILGALSVVQHYGLLHISQIAAYQYEMLLVAFLLLVAGAFFRNV
jgi:hypothetical protein